MKHGFIRQKCPKCGGNLYLDRDYFIEGSFISWYEEETCLQCGFIYNSEKPPEAFIAAVVKNKAVLGMKKLIAV